MNQCLKMFQQNIHFALMLYMGLLCDAHTVSDDCCISICSEPEVIDCRHSNLSSFPQNISPKVKHLDLSHNRLSEVGQYFSKYFTPLQSLDRPTNSLSEFGQNFSKGFTELQSLDLSNNRLSQFGQYFSKDFTALQSLDLSNNQIRDIGQEFFQILPKLKKLDLSNNSLSEFGQNFSKDFTALLRLDLSNNQIRNIGQEFFQIFPYLRKLNLSRNLIQKYRDVIWLHFPSTKEIDLRGNDDLMCECQPVELLNSNVEILGKCHTNFGNEQDEVIPIQNYLQCNHTENIELIVKAVLHILNANWRLENIILKVNNLINTPEKILVDAEQSNRSVNRILDFLETIAVKFSMSGQRATALYSNIGFGVGIVEKDNFNGLVYAVSYGTNETKGSNEIYNDSNAQVDDVMDFISLPKSLLKDVRDEELSNLSRISFLSMDNKLYRVIQKSRTEAKTKINSRIIAANIPNVNITNLDEPVNISLNLLDQDTVKPRCVYWDDSPGQEPYWSTKGCNISKYVPGKKVLCSCNHLTSFAVLMDVYQTEEFVKNSHPLSIISNVGCGISLICLILTIIIHTYFRNLWKLISSKILVNLSISLSATYLIFLIGFQEYIKNLTGLSKAMAALLHYFLLTAFLWMTVEALHIYLGLFVFKTLRSSFIKKSSVFVWGIPAVIVIITLSINTDNYTSIEQGFWLSKTAFYVALLSPVTIILFINLIIFIPVMLRLRLLQNDNHVEHKTHKVRVFGILGMCFLLGFPWLIAYLAYGDAAEVFKYAFNIFTTLQGTFIFICYCIYKRDTRDMVFSYLCKQ